MPRYAELASFCAMLKSGKRPAGSAVALEALLLNLGTAPVVRPRMRATVTN